MPRRPKHHGALLTVALDELMAIQDSGQAITPEHLHEASKTSTYSVRHIRRSLADRIGAATPPDPAGFVDDDVITAVFLSSGNLAAAHRLLARQGTVHVSLRTFQRVVAGAMGTDQLAYARGGSKEFRDFQVYMAMEAVPRMHTLEFDHTELPIYVLPKAHTIPVKPWITAAVDRATRYPLAWALTFGRPTADEVRSVLMQACMARSAPDGKTVVGGRPVRAVWDRGLEFVSALATESCLRLDIIPCALPAYSPNLKPHVERLWRFLQDDLLAPLPGYNAGPEDLRGRRSTSYWVLGAEEFTDRVAEWFDWYCLEHRIEGDRTPLQRWVDDPTPLDLVPDELLWDGMLRSATAKVSKKGIRFDTIDFIAPELTGLVGRTVEIRSLQHDRSFIEVFRDGTHVCTAVPRNELDPEGRARIAQHRKDRGKLGQKRHTTANRVRRDTARGPVQATTTDRNGDRILLHSDNDTDPDIAFQELLAAADADSQQRLFP